MLRHQASQLIYVRVYALRVQFRRVEVYAVNLTELRAHLTSEHSDYRHLTNAVQRSKQVALSVHRNIGITGTVESPPLNFYLLKNVIFRGKLSSTKANLGLRVFQFWGNLQVEDSILQFPVPSFLVRTTPLAGTGGCLYFSEHTVYKTIRARETFHVNLSLISCMCYAMLILPILVVFVCSYRPWFSTCLSGIGLLTVYKVVQCYMYAHCF